MSTILYNLGVWPLTARISLSVCSSVHQHRRWQVVCALTCVCAHGPDPLLPLCRPLHTRVGTIPEFGWWVYCRLAEGCRLVDEGR